MKKTLTIIIFLLLLSSCATYHTRMFVLENGREQVKEYEIYPEIMAYINSAGGGEDLTKDHEFIVFVNVRDTVNPFPKELLKLGHYSPESTDAREEFRQRTKRQFKIDSILIVYLPKGKIVVLPLDDDVLGWGWKLNYYFGNLTIPPEVDTIKVIVPYQSFDSAGTKIRNDTLRYKMHRFESHKKSIWVG